MIPKFRAWDKIDKEMYLVGEINFNSGEFESIVIDGHKFEIKISEVSENGDEARI